MADPIYLDDHATTRCDPRVVDAMLPYFTEHYGNAGSRHTFGMRAQAAVERAREQVAALVGAPGRDVVFTSGATEANNLAILGAVRAVRGRHVVTTSIEHKAVLDPVKQLAKEGVDVTVVDVGADGVVEAEAVIAALRPDTALVSVMWANNEVGTIQPIAAIGAACRARGVAFHTDAAQAVGKVPIDVVAANVDLLSISAHKLYGPKGVGALVARRGRPTLRVEPLWYGGGQERGLRSGTLPVPLCVALGAAADLCRQELDADALSGVRRLRDRLRDGLLAIPGAALNGAVEPRLPGNVNIAFDGVEAAALILATRDLAYSTGSACASATQEPSHVLRAMGVDPERAHASVRFGVGRFTTEPDVDVAVRRLTEEVHRVRALSAI
jgi:cysteine desulfurase